jgi:hypothetical protein
MTSSDLPNIVGNADATSRIIRIYPSGWKSISDSDTRCLDLWMRIDSAIGLNCENF